MKRADTLRCHHECVAIRLRQAFERGPAFGCGKLERCNAPGADAILREAGSLLVASLPAAGLDETRQALVQGTRTPILLVHGGLRPGGLAPEHTLTRFTWSVAEA